MTSLESNMVAASMGPIRLPVTQASLLKIEASAATVPGTDKSSIVVTTWKRAEDGNGSILRLEEIAGASGTVHIDSPYLSIDAASLATALEDPIHSLSVQNGGIAVPYTPFQIITLRLQTTPHISASRSKP